MLAKVLSATTIGLDGVPIVVEVDVAGRGFPTFTIVGLPNKAIDEAKDRIRAALLNTSYEMPDSRLTVNLAPADIPKEGSAFDLPVAVGILAASGFVEKTKLENSIFLGEVSLEGHIRRVPGVVSIALMAREQGIKTLFVPYENAKEAALVTELIIYPVRTLSELILHLNGKTTLTPQDKNDLEEVVRSTSYESDFADIKGQEQAKRALEIAAAGHHNIHLKGVPGAGKTLLSRAFPSILPLMDREEILQVTKIYSVSGMLNGSYFVKERPFRAPHHTTSRIGLIGGGSTPMPGEITLAHRGVLFLDEFPEFPRSVLEAMRQPLEDGVISISRAQGRVTFPSRFLLLAASNPCPCGYLGHPKRKCSCMPGSILKYRKRLSGPLLDRIDIHVVVPPVDEEKLIADVRAESSEAVRKRVEAAVACQLTRFEGSKIKRNGEMTSADIKKYCRFTEDALTILKSAISNLSLSARSYFKVIKVAQTIADLEGAKVLRQDHVSVALQFRVQEE